MGISRMNPVDLDVDLTPRGRLALRGRTMSGLALLIGLALVVGCSKKEPPGNASAKAATAGAQGDPATGEGGEATGDDAPPACKGPEVKGPLAWFSDDYNAALACARESSRPLVIDLWAPWCHTCLSMKHTVLVDKSLEPLAERFVWLELDTDQEKNAVALAKFPPQVWPTFFVAAPADESVQARYLGAASVTQFRAFLGEGEKAVLALQAGDLPEGSPLRLVRDGDQAMAQSEWTAARTSYGQALASLPKESARRPDVLVSMISAFYKGQDYPGCFALAQREMGNTGASASAADFLYYGALCAGRILDIADGKAPAGTTPASELPDAATIKAFREAAVARLGAIVDDEQSPMSVDDRGDAMRIAREIEEALGDKEGARALAERQRALLDDAAAKAETPFAAMTYNWPRAEVYTYLGKPGELVPALQKSVADLPTEYDPPYRLAWIYSRMEKYDEALAMAEKALALGYGPRKTRIQSVIADIHKARGDGAAERLAREAAVAMYKALPESQQNPATLAQLEQALAELDTEKANVNTKKVNKAR